jgi:hypothetical protein
MGTDNRSRSRSRSQKDRQASRRKGGKLRRRAGYTRQQANKARPSEHLGALERQERPDGSDLLVGLQAGE